MNRTGRANGVIGKGWPRNSWSEVFKEGVWDLKSLWSSAGYRCGVVLCLLRDIFREGETCFLMLLCGQLLPLLSH